MTTTLGGLARPLAIAAIGLAGLASLLATGGSPGVTGSGDPENPGSPSGASTWAKSYGGPARDHATSVAPTSDGGLVFAGVYNGQLQNPGILNTETEGDAWVVKLDAFGDVEWERHYGEQRLAGGEGTLRALSITRQGPDGTLWAIGAEVEVQPPRAAGDPYVELRRDASVLRLSPAGQAVGVPIRLDLGAFVELDFFIDGDTADETGHDIWPTADGGALAAIWASALVRGNATTGVPLRAAWIVRLDENGAVRWSRLVTDDRFDHLDDQPARLLVRELADGGAIAAISARLRRDEESGHEVRLVRLDAGGGVSWSVRHARATVHDLVQMDSDGNGVADGDLVLVGVEHEDPLAANVEEDRGLVLRARLADGAQVWRRAPDGVDGIAALYSVAEYCNTTTGGDRVCSYHAVGDSVLGLNRDRYLRTAVAVSVDADGDTIGEAEYPELSSAWQIRPKPGGTNFRDTFQILGERDGGGFYLVVDFTLREIDEIQTFSAFRPGLGRTVFATFASVSDIIDTTARGELGCTTSGDQQRQARIARFTSTATLLWERRYAACSEQRVERAHVVRQTGDGGYFVAAETSDGGEPVAWLLKLDAQGEVLWQRVLEGTYYFADAPQEIADTTDDGGFILGAAAGSRLRLIKLDAGGLEQWNSLPLSPARVLTESPEHEREHASILGGERVSSVRQAPDGGYVAAGRSGDRSWIARLDASGSVLWRRSYGPQLAITSVRPLEGGGYVAAGFSGFSIPWAMRLDQDGNVLWSERYAFGQAAGGPVVRIEVVPSGGFLLAASHIDASPAASAEQAASTGRHNLLVMRLDEDGATRWHRIFGGLYDEFLYGTAVLPDGGFALAARSDSMGDFSEAWVLRLGPDGHVSAGCNALLAAGEGRFDREVNAAALDYTPINGDGLDVPAQVTPRETVLPSLVPADTVVARQCLGTAQPEDPVEPDPGSTFTLTVVQGGGSMGVVTSTPQGIVCGTEGGGTCSAEFEAGSTVFLDVDLGSLQRFARWEGCDDVDGTLCIVEMSEDREVTAFFEEQGIVPLNFQITGNGLVQFDEPGRTCSPETEFCVVNYANGETAVITALPLGEDVLIAWGGDCASFDRAETFELLMDGPKSCTASFSGNFGPTQVLAVERFANGSLILSSGIGRVTSTPAGIDCPEDCAAAFPRDSAVVLRGEPEPGWEFFRFACPDAGDEDFNQLTATIVMDQDETCVANFRNDIVRIAVTFSEPGVGRVTSDQGGLDCTRDCSWPIFMEFGTVELRVEETNSTRFFDHWEGCDNLIGDSQGGPHPVCVMSATRAGSVHASFSMVGGGNTLTIQKADTGGSGRVVSSPAGIDCGERCAWNFGTGSTVVLTAIPDPGSVFSEWRGDPDCVDGTVTMDANLVCEAVFELDTTTFSITISSVTGPGFVQDTSGGGLNCPGVCTASFPANSQVIIFADTTQPGADFLGWGGDCASFGAQTGIILTMDRDYVCSAAFE